MVMENGGLDAQVEQRMDAYRGNPQKLQQRYGQNKELLDLLALQKLTSEKQAASRDMQMKMQQQPGTIAQQREQEALELTKQEMGGTLGELAGRTKGTLDQKQVQQQQNMGKMAQAAAKPQMGRGAGLAGLMGGAARPQPRPAAPPQAQGLAAARMAQGPSKFAGGGIVSFAQGDRVRGSSSVEVTPEEIARYKATMPLGSGRNRTVSDTAIINRILRGREQEAAQARADSADIARQNIEALSSSEQRVLSRTGAAPNDMLSRVATTGTPLQIPEAGIAALMPPTAAPVTPPVAEGDIASLTPERMSPEANVPTPEQTAAGFNVPQTAGATGAGVVPAQNMTSADAAFLKGTRMADEYTGRAAANESYEGMKSRLAEFDEANYGPRDDLNSFLIGMGGTGSIGSAMKGGYSSMLRSKNNRRDRLMDEFQLEKDRIGADAVFSTAGIRLGTQLAADAAANERSMRSAAATMGAAKIREAAAAADRLANANKAELEAASKAMEQAAADRKDRTSTALEIAKLTAETRSNLVGSVVAGDQMLQRLNMQLAASADDPEAAAAIENNMDQRMKYLNLVVDGAMSEFGILDAEKSATDLLTAGLSLPTLTADDVTKHSVDGE